MSRMHMIYDDRPLDQEAVETTKWQSKWDPTIYQNGSGVLLQGVFHRRSHHIIHDREGKKYRYCVFHVEFDQAFQCRYDPKTGKEIEPNFGQTGLVKTGYLNSSYDVQAHGNPDILTYETLVQRIRSPVSELTRPSHAYSLCLWGDEQTYRHLECEFGQGVRLRTKGDSCFLDSFTKLDSERKQYATNYSGGERTGQNWTDKVMGVKSSQQQQEERDGGGGEVDDDEWDD